MTERTSVIYIYILRNYHISHITKAAFRLRLEYVKSVMRTDRVYFSDFGTHNRRVVTLPARQP